MGDGRRDREESRRTGVTGGGERERNMGTKRQRRAEGRGRETRSKRKNMGEKVRGTGLSLSRLAVT